MGMYDEVRCKYPLPLEGANSLLFQTKDTDNQWLDLFEIREDGTLWLERYDIEDRSDHNATGFDALIGMMTRVNKRWEQLDYTGEISFYNYNTETKRWIEFSSYFVKGKLQQLHLIQDRVNN